MHNHSTIYECTDCGEPLDEACLDITWIDGKPYCEYCAEDSNRAAQNVPATVSR